MGLDTVRTNAVTAPTLPSSLVAGVGAGAVAGLVNVGVVLLLHVRLPPADAAAGSSVLAGALGGVVYWLWSRISPRPVAALWLTSLLVATVDSIVVVTLPFPAVRHLPLVPFAGIVTPLLQMLALFHIGRFSHHYISIASIGPSLAQHYICAIVVSLLIPAISRSIGFSFNAQR